MNRNNRSSNIELYRILMMLFIIAHHYVVNSGLTDIMDLNNPGKRDIILLFMGAYGKAGTNCFVLLTGYYLCKTNISFRKYARLLITFEFYKIVEYLIFTVTGYVLFTFEEFKAILRPINGVTTGFMECYLLFYLLIPFLNILINHLDQLQHLILIVLGITIYTIMPSVCHIQVSFNLVSWFIVLYLVASYIRLYDHKLLRNVKLWGWMSVVVWLAGGVSIIYCLKRGQVWNFYVADCNKIVAFGFAFCTFNFFQNLHIKQSRFINMVASTSFGVLLIHTGTAAMRQWLWVDVLGNKWMISSRYLFLHAFFSIVGIYIICGLIESIRIYFLEKPVFHILEPLFLQGEKMWPAMKNRIENKLNKN